MTGVMMMDEENRMEGGHFPPDGWGDITDIPEDADPAALADSGQVDKAITAAYRAGFRDGTGESVVTLMDLARHFHGVTREQFSVEGSELERARPDAADVSGDAAAAAGFEGYNRAMADAATKTRETARWLDGDREDCPAVLCHGSSLSGDRRVPWRQGGDGG